MTFFSPHLSPRHERASAVRADQGFAPLTKIRRDPRTGRSVA